MLDMFSFTARNDSLCKAMQLERYMSKSREINNFLVIFKFSTNMNQVLTMPLNVKNYKEIIPEIFFVNNCISVY